MTIPDLLTLIVARINHHAAPLLARTGTGSTFDSLRKSIEFIRSLAAMIEHRLALAAARLSPLPNAPQLPPIGFEAPALPPIARVLASHIFRFPSIQRLARMLTEELTRTAWFLPLDARAELQDLATRLKQAARRKNLPVRRVQCACTAPTTYPTPPSDHPTLTHSQDDTTNGRKPPH